MSIDLKQELEAMRAIFQKKPVDYWALGKHANAVDEYLGGRKRRRQSTRCFRQELPEIPPSTIYRARMAANHFTPEDVQKWGITKLELLIPYKRKVDRRVLPEGVGDPEAVGDQRIHLLTEDGSSVMKEFRDCSASELRRVTQRRKLTRKPKAEVEAPASPVASASASLGMALVYLISAGSLAAISLRFMSGATSRWGLTIAAALLLVCFFEAVSYMRLAARRRAQASAPPPQRAYKLPADAKHPSRHPLLSPLKSDRGER